MMGRLKHEQETLFYEFRLDEVVPDDHLVRGIAGVLDLSWVRGELASYYSPLGRPSIDPMLMIRMLIVGYVLAIRSERLLCREVQVNLAYRWFCGLSSSCAGSRSNSSNSSLDRPQVGNSGVAAGPASRPAQGDRSVAACQDLL